MKKIKNLFLIAMAALAFNACEDVPAPYTLPGENTGGSNLPEGVYIDESFANDFGVFSTVETEGEYPWIIDYSTAKATSYIDGANNPAQSWLISQPVDFTNETEAYIAFEYIIRYAESGKVAANHQLLISSDYAGDPATATWTNIDYNAVEGSDWQTFAKANVDVPAEFMGKNNVTFAFKYTAKSKAGTWEVKNFIVEHGKSETNNEAPANGIYIDESFANDFGVFSTVETEGEYPWIIDYSTAKATSYIDGANNPAQSWLISLPVDFTNETEAYIAFEYIIRYAESGKVAANHQLLISSDYAGDPATATWTNIDYNAVEGSDWQTFAKANVDVPTEFMGKNNVTFAFKYSAQSKAGTWEVKNLVVAHGKGGNDGNEGEDNENDDTDSYSALFDFTKPTELTPSITPSAAPSSGVEFDEITFTNNGYSIYAKTGTASNKVRIWTRTGGDTELRSYNGSTITISAPEGETLTGIVFSGNKVSTMTADSGTFEAGKWSGNASSVTFKVTATLNITTLSVK